METASNYRRRGLFVSWLRLPFTLLSIRGESLADAAEEVRYLESHRRSYLSSRPMQIVLAALRRRVARG
jgi:hypothetical protein